MRSKTFSTPTGCFANCTGATQVRRSSRACLTQRCDRRHSLENEEPMSPRLVARRCRKTGRCVRRGRLGPPALSDFRGECGKAVARPQSSAFRAGPARHGLSARRKAAPLSAAGAPLPPPPRQASRSWRRPSRTRREDGRATAHGRLRPASAFPGDRPCRPPIFTASTRRSSPRVRRLGQQRRQRRANG